MRRWAADCRRLFVLSPDAVRRAPPLLGIEPEKTVWAPNGFDPEAFDRRPLSRAERLALWREWLVDDPRGWDLSGVPGSVAYRRGRPRGLQRPGARCCSTSAATPR